MKESFIVLAGFSLGWIIFIIGLNIVTGGTRGRQWSEFQINLALVLLCILTVVIMFAPTLFVVISP